MEKLSFCRSMPRKRRCHVEMTAAAALAIAAAAKTTGAAPRRPWDPLVVPASVEIEALLRDHREREARARARGRGSGSPTR